MSDAPVKHPSDCPCGPCLAGNKWGLSAESEKSRRPRRRLLLRTRV